MNNTSRRSFLFGSTAMTAGLAISGTSRTKPKIDHAAATPRNRMPYTGVDWTKALQINTTSHGHCISDADVAKYVNRRRFQFLTISNYYPSAPTCPLNEVMAPRGLPVWNHPVVKNGVLTDGPFDWNAIVAEWKDKIDEKHRGGYPFKVRGRMFPKGLPEGVLEAPNAEHHGFLDDKGKKIWQLHICCPGSAYASGTFDAHDYFGTSSHGYEYGSGLHWKDAFDRMIDGLICPDGGGITINHPTWSVLQREFIPEMLDYDPRVLGIEVLENGVNSEVYWDWVLSTGRQCFGFFVPDWGGVGKRDIEIFGINVLVVPEKTVEACLKAYRQGNFYGATRGFGELAFTKIDFSKNGLVCTTDKPATFEVITARGVVKKVQGTEVTWSLWKEGGNEWWKKAGHIFMRVRATALDGCGETLYTQAGMLQ